MEIILNGIKLTAGDVATPFTEHDTMIVIEFIGEPGDVISLIRTVPASELKPAIEALEKSCWRR